MLYKAYAIWIVVYFVRIEAFIVISEHMLYVCLLYYGIHFVVLMSFWSEAEAHSVDESDSLENRRLALCRHNHCARGRQGT